MGKNLYKNNMWELIVQLGASIFLAVLAGDLLYLYHLGMWIEPTDVIAKAELLTLYAFTIGGLGNAIRVIIVLRSVSGI